MIRAEHPTDPQEGLIHADGLSAEDLDRARDRGWQITELNEVPDLGLPPNADRLWRGARAAAGMAWWLEQRVDLFKGHRITVLHIHGLDRPGRWEEWSWVGGVLNPARSPRISLRRAHALLVDRTSRAAAV